jgi:hypothetical protein
MKDLLDVYSRVYMNKALLEALKDYNIEYNIIRYLIFIFIFIFKKNLLIILKLVL